MIKWSFMVLQVGNHEDFFYNIRLEWCAERGRHDHLSLFRNGRFLNSSHYSSWINNYHQSHASCLTLTHINQGTQIETHHGKKLKHKKKTPTCFFTQSSSFFHSPVKGHMRTNHSYAFSPLDVVIHTLDLHFTIITTLVMFLFWNNESNL